MPLRNAHYYTSSPDWLVFSTDPTSPVYALQHPPGPSPSASPSNPSSTNSPTIQERRKALAIEEAANAKEHPLERYGYESIDREVRMRDGGWIRVRVYSPLRKEGKGAGKGLPGLFVTHGGGRRPNEDEPRSPEHPYPIPLDDCWDALQWTYKNASSLSIDPSRLILAGSSAGACLSASLALRSTTTTTNPRILGSILNVPVLCHYAHLPHGKYELKSYEQCEDPSLLLHSAEMREVWGESINRPRVLGGGWTFASKREEGTDLIWGGWG
ncbi:MAG: hypothetical protein M1827_005075 [Pycnora praestabilis]|nr:MAG: hypothetical protein M1827_005075 [Pycnora praestabilis]